MSEDELPQPRPARPLYGYRDIGAAGARHSRRAQTRAWVILVAMIVLYLAVVLTIYFIEPGLR
jgi:t-SNARE complex subunit (syntaxin)